MPCCTLLHRLSRGRLDVGQYASAWHCIDRDVSLGGLAEFERDLIRSRTGEGRARANLLDTTRRISLLRWSSNAAGRYREPRRDALVHE